MNQNIKIIRSKRRSIAITVKPDSTIIVKAPLLIPKFFIDKFIKNHEDWITKQLNHQPKSTNKKYENGEEFLFLGLKIKLQIGDYKEISVKNGKLFFPNFLQFRIQKQLTSWYIKQAKEIIAQQVDYYSKEMNTSYSGLTFSDTTSQWGSCSPDNHLQFSWRLIMTPSLTLNYVVEIGRAHV